jgi:hypothetical protein
VLDSGGSGYVQAPMMVLHNDYRDPFGAADPSVNSGSGLLLPPSTAQYPYLKIGGSAIPVDQIAIFCATISSAFTCKWMA